MTQINEGLPAVEAGIAQIEAGIPVLQDNIQKLTDVLTQGMLQSLPQVGR